MNMSYCRFHNTSIDFADCASTVREMLDEEYEAEDGTPQVISGDEMLRAKQLIAASLELVLLLADRCELPVEELGEPHAADNLYQALSLANDRAKEVRDELREERQREREEACRDLLAEADTDCDLGGDYHTAHGQRYAPGVCPYCRARAVLAKVEGGWVRKEEQS